MSQADVVQALHSRITQGTLSKIEHGLTQPVEGLVNVLATALRVRPSFFLRSSYIRAMPVSYHRKRQKLSARDEAAIHAQSEVYRINLKKMLEAVELEVRKPPIPAFDLDAHPTIMNVASSLRQHWSLPRGPIKTLTQLLEDAGAIVIPFNFGTSLMDGFCQHTGDGLPPVIFINSTQPADRYRYSLAHELSHLVLHRTPNPEQELQANRLAAEFLMPSAEIRPQFHNLSLQKLMDLKLYWGVSMQALVYRAWELGAISDRGRKYYFVEMSKRGWRDKEPIEIPDA